MYQDGTGKPADYMNDKGEYPFIYFVKGIQPLLKERGIEVTLENDDEFVEKFITLLFQQKKEAEGNTE